MNREVMGIIVKKDDGSESVNYNNDYFPSYIHSGWIEPKVTWANVPHFHEDVEFITVWSGKMGYNVNGRNYILNEGDTIFVNSGQIHYSHDVTEERARYYIYVFNPSLLCANYVVEEKSITPIISNTGIPCIVFRKNEEFGDRIFEQAKRLQTVICDEFHTTMEYYNLWDIILDYFNKNDLMNDDFKTDSQLNCYKEMHHYIRDNYDRNITLDDISMAGNVSKTYCNRLFCKYTGRTPIENLIRYRAERVSYYLTNEDMSMAEIAERTGFSGAGYMAEIFKKIYGTSPRDYKKEARRTRDAQNSEDGEWYCKGNGSCQ